MNRKRTIIALLLAVTLSGAVGIASLNRNTASDPPQVTSTKKGKGTLSGSEKLIGKWQLVTASVTPDFLKVPIPINTIDARGTVTDDYTYTISANGSFFGSNYGYLGSGDIDVEGASLTLTINDGVITVNEKKKRQDKKGGTISGSYRMSGKDTLQVEAVKYQDGIGYTFHLELVNS
ncbi:MAG: hypothetical protein C1941_01665 [Prosthecochloris sp.]|nr:hypothetical protein [Prosthecochloris sp.]